MDILTALLVVLLAWIFFDSLTAVLIAFATVAIVLWILRDLDKR